VPFAAGPQLPEQVASITKSTIVVRSKRIVEPLNFMKRSISGLRAAGRLQDYGRSSACTDPTEQAINGAVPVTMVLHNAQQLSSQLEVAARQSAGGVFQREDEGPLARQSKARFQRWLLWPTAHLQAPVASAD
jgi:hypothetical protein